MYSMASSFAMVSSPGFSAFLPLSHFLFLPSALLPLPLPLLAVLLQGMFVLSYFSVFLPGLKGGKVLILEKGTFVRGLSF